MGGVHIARGDFAAAMSAFEKSLSLYDKAEDRKGMAQEYLDLAILYEHVTKRPRKALQMYDKYLELMTQEKAPIPEELATAIGRLRETVSPASMANPKGGPR